MKKSGILMENHVSLYIRRGLKGGEKDVTI